MQWTEPIRRIGLVTNETSAVWPEVPIAIAASCSALPNPVKSRADTERLAQPSSDSEGAERRGLCEYCAGRANASGRCSQVEAFPESKT
jgi:hypothetical protein